MTVWNSCLTDELAEEQHWDLGEASSRVRTLGALSSIELPQGEEICSPWEGLPKSLPSLGARHLLAVPAGVSQAC